MRKYVVSEIQNVWWKKKTFFQTFDNKLDIEFGWTWLLKKN